METWVRRGTTALYFLGGFIGYCVAEMVYPESPGLGEAIFLMIEYDYFKEI